MRRVLAHEVQIKARGGFDQKTARAIKKLQGQKRQDDGVETSKSIARRLKSGSRLMREWNGVTHQVEVLETGYLWQGEKYRSLSAIAKAITGAHWSGPRFFGTTENGGANG